VLQDHISEATAPGLMKTAEKEAAEVAAKGTNQVKDNCIQRDQLA
jgi:hypothetical protein